MCAFYCIFFIACHIKMVIRFSWGFFVLCIGNIIFSMYFFLFRFSNSKLTFYSIYLDYNSTLQWCSIIFVLYTLYYYLLFINISISLIKISFLSVHFQHRSVFLRFRMTNGESCGVLCARGTRWINRCDVTQQLGVVLKQRLIKPHFSVAVRQAISRTSISQHFISIAVFFP